MTLTDYARQDTKEDLLKLCIRRTPQVVLECFREVMNELRITLDDYEKPKGITLSNTIEEPTLVYDSKKDKKPKEKKQRGRPKKVVSVNQIE